MGTNNSNPQPGDIDARLQFLLTSTESLHATASSHQTELAELRSAIAAVNKQTSDLVTATAALLFISQ